MSRIMMLLSCFYFGYLSVFDDRKYVILFLFCICFFVMFILEDLRDSRYKKKDDKLLEDSKLLCVGQAKIVFNQDDFLYIKYDDGECGYMIVMDEKEFFIIKGTNRPRKVDIDVARYNLDTSDKIIQELFDCGCYVCRNETYRYHNVDRLRDLLKESVRWD